MLAYDYPLLSVFWTMLWFFVFVIWFVLLFRVIGDLFRSHDIGGLAKTLWLILVLILPFLGVFIYLIARGNAMGERAVADAQARDKTFRA